MVPAAQKSAFDAAATPLRDSLQSVADSLYQSQSHAGEDPLNYPIRLNNRIGALMGVVSSAWGRPTKQSYEVYDLLSGLIDIQMGRMKAAMAGVTRVNAVLKQAGMPAIDVAAKDVPGSGNARSEEGEFDQDGN